MKWDVWCVEGVKWDVWCVEGVKWDVWCVEGVKWDVWCVEGVKWDVWCVEGVKWDVWCVEGVKWDVWRVEGVKWDVWCVEGGCVCWRCEVDVHTEAGCKKAENLFKELMMKISAMQESFRSQPSYVLEQTLDFSTACLQFKVNIFCSL